MKNLTQKKRGVYVACRNPEELIVKSITEHF